MNTENHLTKRLFQRFPSLTFLFFDKLEEEIREYFDRLRSKNIIVLYTYNSCNRYILSF